MTDPQHLDEGTLRAYLDETAGGRKSNRHDVLRHLAVCAPCRARLEVARRGDQPLVEPSTAWSPLRFSRVSLVALAATVALILGVVWHVRSAPTASSELRDATCLPQPPLPVPDTPSSQPAVAVVTTPTDTQAPAIQAVESLPPAATPSIPAPPVTEEEAPLPWINVTAGTAGQRIGGPLALLPDLPLIQIMISRSEPAMVRFSYRLGLEVGIELVQERITAAVATRDDSIAASAASSGLGAASVDWRGYRLTVVGPLPADSLYGLLRRLPQQP